MVAQQIDLETCVYSTLSRLHFEMDTSPIHFYLESNTVTIVRRPVYPDEPHTCDHPYVFEIYITPYPLEEMDGSYFLDFNFSLARLIEDNRRFFV